MRGGRVMTGWALLIGLVAGGCVTVDVPEPRLRSGSGVNVTGTVVRIAGTPDVPDSGPTHVRITHAEIKNSAANVLTLDRHLAHRAAGQERAWRTPFAEGSLPRPGVS